MSYCIYLRKSRADREAEAQGEAETLARHEKTLLAFAKKHKLNITKIFREVVSGETIAARPQMQKLLDEVEQELWEGVLVMEIERLARGNTKDQGIVAEAFQFSNTKIITPSKTYDPNNEFDEEYFEFGLFMSRREYKTINRRLQRGRLASVNEGKYVGNIAPYGYDRVKLPKEKGFTLAPNNESDIVKLIFQLYTIGDIKNNIPERLGVSKICNYLNKLNIKPRKGDVWVNATIQTILRNPVYIGKIKWNSRPAVKSIVNGEIKRTRPRAKEYTVVDGLHPAIIDDEVFNTAQEYINTNRAKPINKTNTLKNPLAGIVKCGICGRTMVRRPYANSNQADTFMCPLTACKNVSSPLIDVENSLIDIMQEWLDNYKVNWQLEKEKLNKDNLTETILKESLAKETEEKTKLEMQLENLHDLLEQGVYDINKFLERSKILNERITAVNNNIAEYEENLAKSEEIDKTKSEIIPNLEHVIKIYPTLTDPLSKNKLLKEVLEKVVYFKTDKNKKGCSDRQFKLIIYPRLPQ